MAGKRRLIDPPVWSPRHGRYRVLVEARDGTWRREVVSALEAAGYEVIACGGPDPSHDRSCPVVEGGRCPTSPHADVVVCDVDAGDREHRELPVAVAHELRAGATVIALLTPELEDRYRHELEGCRRLHHPVGTGELLGAVAAALDELAGTPAPRPLRPSRRPRPPGPLPR